jgi:CHASE2 domain-containing sensor protein/signal transduction histidine kinase
VTLIRLLAGVLALGLALLGAWSGTFASTDRRLQDFFSTSAHRAVSDDVVIIAIDDKSLAALGRWPWSRAVHAALLQQVSAQQPRAIGVDLFLTEPTTGWEDSLLAQAITHSPMLTLPVMVAHDSGNRGHVLSPIPALADAAHGLGHVHIQVDPDGMVRSVPGAISDGTQDWRHMALEMLAPSALTAAATPDTDIRIPYAGQAGMFTRHSYVDVLKGTLPPHALKDKLVLIGVVSAGLGDIYVTPATGTATLMPGVEIIANFLDAQVQGITLAPAGTIVNACVSALIVVLAVAMFIAGGGATVWRVLALSAGVLGAGWCTARVTGVLLAPGAALFTIWGYFLLWNAMRMRAVAKYFFQEVHQLEDAPSRFSQIQPSPQWNWLHGDVLDRDMFSMSNATRQLGQMHAFVESTLDGLPEPLYVTDTTQVVKIANARAIAAFSSPNGSPLGSVITELLADLVPAREGPPSFPEMLSGGTECPPCEMTDSRQRHWLVRAKPYFSEGSIPEGWIISLSDLSSLRQAERAREELLQFVSHDIRSPQSSIIALIDSHRLDGGGDMPMPVVEKIEDYALYGLEISNAFVQLSRAQAVEYRADEVAVGPLLDMAIDEVSPRAHMAGVTLSNLAADSYGLVLLADAQLLRRAIVNLLVNAVKFSPAGSTVTCTATETDGFCRLEVQDQGPGVTPEQEARLFKPFATLGQEQGAHAAATSIGLGLRMVQTVADRHHGRTGVARKPGMSGACFFMELPLPPSLEREDGSRS